jgi:hypothetical protein
MSVSERSEVRPPHNPLRTEAGPVKGRPLFFAHPHENGPFYLWRLRPCGLADGDCGALNERQLIKFGAGVRRRKEKRLPVGRRR